MVVHRQYRIPWYMVGVIVVLPTKRWMKYEIIHVMTRFDGSIRCARKSTPDELTKALRVAECSNHFTMAK